MAITTPGKTCRHRVETVFSGGEHATAAARNAKNPARRASRRLRILR
jgi:hypothetical protein